MSQQIALFATPKPLEKPKPPQGIRLDCTGAEARAYQRVWKLTDEEVEEIAEMEREALAIWEQAWRSYKAELAAWEQQEAERAAREQRQAGPQP